MSSAHYSQTPQAPRTKYSHFIARRAHFIKSRTQQWVINTGRLRLNVHLVHICERAVISASQQQQKKTSILVHITHVWHMWRVWLCQVWCAGSKVAPPRDRQASSRARIRVLNICGGCTSCRCDICKIYIVCGATGRGRMPRNLFKPIRAGDWGDSVCKVWPSGFLPRQDLWMVMVGARVSINKSDNLMRFYLFAKILWDRLMGDWCVCLRVVALKELFGSCSLSTK